MQDYSAIISFVRDLFPKQDFIPLHEPKFVGNERKYVVDAIDSTFVSSVGAYVNRFEEMMQEITGARFAVATTNGTSALHLALVVSGIGSGDEVITQPLTFVATANAIKHSGAEPVFIDVDRDTMGLSPKALKDFLEKHTLINAKGHCVNKQTGKRIAACVPMHTFGFPLRIEAVKQVCDQYNIALIEDAAESLGSYYNGIHTGRFGSIGTFSFNGNKTVTCGGGGALITDDEKLAKAAKHLSTTAKQPHAWEFYHDSIGYNYRLPNLNAALACAQLEQLPLILDNKRELALAYSDFFKSREEKFISELNDTRANYWLNTIILSNKEQRDLFLTQTNQQNVMTRPIWKLMNSLPMYEHCQSGNLNNSVWLEERVVNIPSSYRP